MNTFSLKNTLKYHFIAYWESVADGSMANLKKWTSKTGIIEALGIRRGLSLDYLVDILGMEHLIVNEPMATASGIERLWVFEIYPNAAFAFIYHDIIETVWVGTNKAGHLNLQEVHEIFPQLHFEPTCGRLWE